MYTKDLGYYTWCAVNDHTGEVIAKGFKHCDDALYWCETHNVEVSNVDYHGTRI